MPRHLQPEDFVDLAEGHPIPAPKSAHLEQCERCRTEAETLSSMFDTLREASSEKDSPAADPGAAAMLPEWSLMRASIRDELLSRAVRRSGVLARWLPVFAPRPAWGVALAVLVLVAVLAGVGTDRGPDPATSPEAAEAALFLDDPAALETEALAWSEPEIFVSLNELDASEEEALLELIALTFGDDGI